MKDFQAWKDDYKEFTFDDFVESNAFDSVYCRWMEKYFYKGRGLSIPDEIPPFDELTQEWFVKFKDYAVSSLEFDEWMEYDYQFHCENDCSI